MMRAWITACDLLHHISAAVHVLWIGLMTFGWEILKSLYSTCSRKFELSNIKLHAIWTNMNEWMMLAVKRIPMTLLRNHLGIDKNALSFYWWGSRGTCLTEIVALTTFVQVLLNHILFLLSFLPFVFQSFVTLAHNRLVSRINSKLHSDPICRYWIQLFVSAQMSSTTWMLFFSWKNLRKQMNKWWKCQWQSSHKCQLNRFEILKLLDRNQLCTSFRCIYGQSALLLIHCVFYIWNCCHRYFLNSFLFPSNYRLIYFQFVLFCGNKSFMQ